jgi:hypothetical protein
VKYSHTKEPWKGRAHTFAFVPVCFFLGLCSLSARLIKGEKVECKVTKFELYSGVRMSGEPVVR